MGWGLIGDGTGGDWIGLDGLGWGGDARGCSSWVYRFQNDGDHQPTIVRLSFMLCMTNILKLGLESAHRIALSVYSITTIVGWGIRRSRHVWSLGKNNAPLS